MLPREIAVFLLGARALLGWLAKVLLGSLVAVLRHHLVELLFDGPWRWRGGAYPESRIECRLSSRQVSISI